MRLRLAGTGVVVAVITIIVFWILLAGVVQSAATEDQTRALETLAVEASDAPTITEPAEAQVVIDPSQDSSPFVMLLDDEGAALYTTGVIDGIAPRIPAAVIVEALDQGTSNATFEVDGTSLRVYAVRWERDPQPAGVAVAAQSTAFVTEQVAGAQVALAIATILTLIAAAVVAWFVAGRALRPLNTLIETADDIAATGDLRRRLQPAKRKDEVQKLTASFNGMLDELDVSARRLEDSLERQRRFVADASHELRTPLTTIRSNAGFLAERPDADQEDRRDAAQDIVAEADRMARLVGDLLVLARADADVSVRAVPVDLAATAFEVCRQAGDGVAFNGPDAALVRGDPDLLTQLAWILVDNAQAHGAAPIEVTVTCADAECHLTVDDSGPGVPPSERERVFDRFHRVDWARSGEGSGLGLAIAREIAVQHGGSIELAESPLGGARFTVNLGEIS